MITTILVIVAGLAMGVLLYFYFQKSEKKHPDNGADWVEDPDEIDGPPEKPKKV